MKTDRLMCDTTREHEAKMYISRDLEYDFTENSEFDRETRYSIPKLRYLNDWAKFYQYIKSGIK